MLVEQGPDAILELFRIMMNEAMKLERSHDLKAQPYERTEERLDYANGFKNRSITTGLGKVELKNDSTDIEISTYSYTTDASACDAASGYTRYILQDNDYSTDNSGDKYYGRAYIIPVGSLGSLTAPYIVIQLFSTGLYTQVGE